MLEASKQPGAPSWLPPVAASFLAEGGARDSARALWTELANTTDQDWLRTTANRALLQMDAEAVIEELQPVVNRYYDIRGSFPSGWPDLVSAGLIQGIPSTRLESRSRWIQSRELWTCHPIRRFFHCVGAAGSLDITWSRNG